MAGKFKVTWTFSMVRSRCSNCVIRYSVSIFQCFSFCFPPNLLASFSPATERFPLCDENIGCRQPPSRCASLLLVLLRKERLSVPNLIGPEWVLWFWTNQCAQIWVIMPTHSDSQSYQDRWGERTVDQPQPWQCSAVSIVGLNLRNTVLPFHGLVLSRDAGTSRGAAEGHSTAH